MASSPSPSSALNNASAVVTPAAAAPRSSSPSTLPSAPTMTSSPPPSSSTPPPTTPSSPAPVSQPNATPADPSGTPPASSPPVSSPSTPVSAASPPPSPPVSPPPASPPPVTPPPQPAVTAPPPASPLLTPPVVPASPPPTPPAALSPPPLSVAPPKASPLPPSLPPPVLSPPPPDASSPPPSNNSPSLPPPSINPPTRSPAPPARTSPSPPVAQSPPPSSPPTPPSTRPPKSSPGGRSPPHPSSPRTPSAPPQSPSLSSPPSANPTNPSPDSPSPPSAVPSTPGSPMPLPTPATAVDPANPNTPNNPNSNKSSTPGGQGGSPSPSGGLSSGATAAIAVVLGILVLSLIGAAVWYTKKRKRPTNGYHAGFVMPSPFTSPQASGESANQISPFAPSVQTNYNAGSPGYKEPMSEISMANSRFFTFEELYEITNGFSDQNLLGEGGFGSVYKGCLSDGREVAVKQLKDGGGQGEREFHAEVEIISRVHHRHLVSLVGYCIAHNQRLLVYDFVPNNMLHYHLHGRGRPVLEWPARVKIAAGAARGIAYLHEDCHPRIIHRDIKSSNILLDNNFEAQVADFGLARLALDAVTHVTTRVMGTFGYLAPEYASSGKLTERSDVFSFGVVLLELITGRKPVDASRPLGDESLVEWARPLLTQALDTGDLGDLVDPRLEKNFNEVEMFRMIEAAAACVRHSASKRPRMSQVVRVLDSLADVDLTNGVQPGKSELFNVANTAEIRLFQRMAFGSQDCSSDFSQSSWNSRSRDIDASGSRLL